MEIPLHEATVARFEVAKHETSGELKGIALLSVGGRPLALAIPLADLARVAAATCGALATALDEPRPAPSPVIKPPGLYVPPAH